MNSNSGGTVMKEQPARSRDVPLDEVAMPDDDVAAFQGPENSHPSELLTPVNRVGGTFVISDLPQPKEDPKLLKRIKASRNRNAHDVPSALTELDDDECGSPEPVIPCETPGNTTLCEPSIILQPPAPPVAEQMPPIPRLYSLPRNMVEHTNISVEFVDFGKTSQVFADKAWAVGRVIEEAGTEFAITESSIQLVRNSGADVQTNVRVAELVDQKELIVYLKCAHRRFKDALINEIAACEDSVVRDLVAVVEIPAFKATYPIHVKSNQFVSDVISACPMNIAYIARITYNGENVTVGTALESIGFRNNSAFVVYPHEPCPSHSPSPSFTQTAQPSPSPSTTMSPFPTPQHGHGTLIDHGVRPPLFAPGTRPVMTQAAKIQVEVEGKRLPIEVSPIAKGSDLFDAVAKLTGKTNHFMKSVFLDRGIFPDTALNVFGFIDGDVVQVEIAS
eukprot:c46232_g1_i1.p1 GENE.c46232_g1_i1~~c46232_g1_i1.p1  ORF type:complete len:522 (-),score=82.27 c46232_g1_i1:53-1396(-)